MVSYGLTVEARTHLRDLEVVECGHSEVNEARGYCNFCGKLYAGKITDKNGAVRYVEKWQNDDFADGNTVTLLQSVGIIAPESSCTIEMNGRAADMINFLVPGGTLTLKGDGNIGTVDLGYTDADSTLVIEDKAYWWRIEIGTLFVNKTTNTKLTGGRFGMIERKDGGFVEELLAEGYAFFDPVWDEPFYLPGKTSLDKTYYIAAHEHWFDVDPMTGETVCKCGLICRHTTIGADGKCADVCKRQIYVAVLTKADETETKYEAFADAFAAAAESEDAILTLLCDVDLDGDELTLDHGKFTLDLGSYTLKNFAHHQVLAVSGTADIVIKNGVLHNTFNTTKGGQLFVSTGNAIDMRGGSLTLVGVVDGDTVQLLCGVPTFDRVTVGKGIGISFTKFALFGDDVTIGNYKLPAADEVGPDDKDGIDRVKKIVDGLTENERAMLGDAAGKPDALIEKIRALADSKNDTPKTGEMSDLALWFALLFVSGGAFAGIRLAGKKKTEE